MVTVSTKEGLEKALKNKEKEIEITGELADKIRKQRKRKKRTGYAVAGASLIAGIAALPFTGGASIGLVAGTAGGGFLAMKTAELIVICASVLGLSGGVIYLLKQYEFVEVDVDPKTQKGRLILKKKQGNK